MLNAEAHVVHSCQHHFVADIENPFYSHKQQLTWHCTCVCCCNREGCSTSDSGPCASLEQGSMHSVKLRILPTTQHQTNSAKMRPLGYTHSCIHTYMCITVSGSTVPTVAARGLTSPHKESKAVIHTWLEVCCHYIVVVMSRSSQSSLQPIVEPVQARARNIKLARVSPLQASHKRKETK